LSYVVGGVWPFSVSAMALMCDGIAHRSIVGGGLVVFANTSGNKHRDEEREKGVLAIKLRP